MGFIDRITRRMSKGFGEDCAKVMVRSFNAARGEFPDAPEPAVLIQAISMRPAWAVGIGGPLIFKGRDTGHIVDEKMTLSELIYIVVTVELCNRLGASGAGATGDALIQANEFLVSQSLDERFTSASGFTERFQQWAGSFWFF